MSTENEKADRPRGRIAGFGPRIVRIGGSYSVLVDLLDTEWKGFPLRVGEQPVPARDGLLELLCCL